MANRGALADALREPFREGEPVLIIEPRGKHHVVRLKLGRQFHHPRTGYIAHESIVGRPPGVLLLSESYQEVICLRPTWEDYVLKKLRRRTSIIHPKDLAPLLLRGDLYPGARVLEAGIGSGAATLTLLRFLGREGELVSYERRQEFIDLALANIREVHHLYGDPQTPHRIELRDIYDGISECDLDAVLLDLPEPHRSAPAAAEALRSGGTLLSWLPTVTQVYLLVRELQRDLRWAAIETTELLQREWQVRENAMRPHHKMIAHTGFLIRARRLCTEEAQGRHTDA